jgi:hypothetical protein
MCPLSSFLSTCSSVRRSKSGLRKRYFRIIRGKARNSNVMVSFCKTQSDPFPSVMMPSQMYLDEAADL